MPRLDDDDIAIGPEDDDAALRRALAGEPARAQPPRQQTIRKPERKTVQFVTLSENEEKNGYEIRFPDKPEAQVLKRLLDEGWRFLPNYWKDPLWYRRRSEQSYQFALALVRELGGKIAVRTPAQIASPLAAPASPAARDVMDW